MKTGGQEKMADKRYHIVVIGAGAAGMAAAIAALEEAGRIGKKETGKNGPKPDCKVLLLESNDRAGKKLLATGNGKCNFTHENIAPEHYHTDDRAVLEAVLSGFPTKGAVSFFEGLGMLSREKNGYFYPLPETASTVLDVLRLRLSELGCEISCGIFVERVQKAGEGFFLTVKEQEKRRQIHAGSVVLATGSRAGGFLQNKQEDPLRPARALGLRSSPLYPALVKCICREAHYYKQLAGVRAKVRLGLYVYGENDLSGRSKTEGKTAGDGGKPVRTERGELQLTKEGISGIAVFQLSGEIAQKLAEGKRLVVEINFLPDFPEEELEAWLKRRLSLLPGRSLEEFFLGVLHKKVLQACLQAEKLKGNMRIPDRDAEGAFLAGERYLPAGKRAFIMAASVMKRAMHFTTEVIATADLKQAQVCRGGLYLSQFHENLECRTLPGLFACGEVLNVDGECGGYNLHFAWGSGILAGKEAVRRVLKAD